MPDDKALTPLDVHKIRAGKMDSGLERILRSHEALRTQLAEVTQRAEHLREQLIVHGKAQVRAEAQSAALRLALKEAMEAVETFHGAAGWYEYTAGAPEWKRWTDLVQPEVTP